MMDIQSMLNTPGTYIDKYLICLDNILIKNHNSQTM